MTKFKKKGFTIVELVIVIAVIAILAAVLIPTFSNIIRRAKISADVQLCRNLNTVLANADAEGRIPGSMYDVLYLENEAGYILDNLNPTAEGYYYAWDSRNNKILYIMDDLETVYYPEDYNLYEGSCWITVGTAEEAELVAAHGYNIALENDISDDIVLSNVVSIDTLGFNCSGNVTVNSGSKDVETATFSGSFGNELQEKGMTINASSSSNIVTKGTVSSLHVSNASSVVVAGNVTSFSAVSGVSSEVVSTGTIKSVDSTKNGSSIVNNGVITNANGANVTGEGNKGIVQASSKEDLDNIRIQVATGANSFKNQTVTLTKDVNLNNISFTPISNFYRGNSTTDYFSGTFDGNGYEIQNFSNNGFSISGLNAGHNDSSVYFGETQIRYNEAVYGLFACTLDATFKNVTINCNISMIADNANKMVGDSVGGIVGFAYGNYVKFENCVVSGTIEGYDAVGGLLGRAYCRQVEIKNCTNNAYIGSVVKCGGLVGYFDPSTGKIKDQKYWTTDVDFEVENCKNTGNVVSYGSVKEVELVAWTVKDGLPKDKVTLKSPSNESSYSAALATTSSALDTILGSSSKYDGELPEFTNTGMIFYGTSVENKNNDGKYVVIRRI